MGKIMALDLGDQWVGVAVSDSLGIFAKPYKTVPTGELEYFLKDILAKERIQEIVVGYPRTMRGGESEQTRKVLRHKELLEAHFPEVPFTLWDERLSSQRAKAIGTLRTKEDKLRAHALAAAFVLDSYLSFLQGQKKD